LNICLVTTTEAMFNRTTPKLTIGQEFEVERKAREDARAYGMISVVKAIPQEAIAHIKIESAQYPARKAFTVNVSTLLTENACYTRSYFNSSVRGSNPEPTIAEMNSFVQAIVDSAKDQDFEVRVADNGHFTVIIDFTNTAQLAAARIAAAENDTVIIASEQTSQ
jgi:hypothetical protein